MKTNHFDLEAGPSENKPVTITYKFGSLVDEEARQELLRFRETFDRSQNSQTIFVNHKPVPKKE